MDCSPQWFTDEFGSPGMLRTMFVFGNSTWRYGVWSVAWFPHLLYWLWPIGVAARHLEILNRRGRTRLAWLWPCGRAGMSFFDVHWYTWLWPCERKVTSLPRGASIYMVVAMWEKRRRFFGKEIISCIVVAMRDKRRVCVIDVFIVYTYTYVCLGMATGRGGDEFRYPIPIPIPKPNGYQIFFPSPSPPGNGYNLVPIPVPVF